MKIHTAIVSIINACAVHRAPATVCPTPLTKSELVHVAAAGSKPGLMGGSGITK
jgi:hypothetical protein